MKTASQLREQTRNTFRGHWGRAIAMCLLPIVYFIIAFIVLAIITVIFSVLSNLATGIAAVSIIGAIIYWLGTIVLALILSIMMIGVTYKFIDWDNDPELDLEAPSAAFTVFKNYNARMVIKIALWQLLFTALWSLLFYIPGIIKSFSYSQAFNLYKSAVDNGTADQYNAIDYITQSRKLMDGHKGSLFYLQLTFIGWGLLAEFSLGIGLLWLVPYITGTRAAFYNDLVKNNK